MRRLGIAVQPDPVAHGTITVLTEPRRAVHRGPGLPRHGPNQQPAAGTCAGMPFLPEATSAGRPCQPGDADG